MPRTSGNIGFPFDPESPTELSPGMQMSLNNLTDSYKTILQLCVHYIILAGKFSLHTFFLKRSQTNLHIRV